MKDTHDLRRYYIGDDGTTESRCEPCGAGLQRWAGPEHQSVTPDGWCPCCYFRREQCTHRPGIQNAWKFDHRAPDGEEPRSKKMPGAKATRANKAKCPFCGKRDRH